MEQPPRLWILPAKAARIALVMRRKPTKVWRFYIWDTLRNEVNERSRLPGPFLPREVDVSWDGRLWLFPRYWGQNLAPIGEASPTCWVRSDAFFCDQNALGCRRVSLLESLFPALPTWTRPLRLVQIGIEPFLATQRRDGWEEVSSGRWKQQPGPDHPALLRHDSFSQRRGYHARFQLEGSSDVIDERVSWATYDFMGDLLVGRAGVLQRYRLIDLDARTPCFEFDLNERMPEQQADLPLGRG